MSLGSLGRLGIEIYADTAQFTGDLGKAERGAKQFATNVESSIGKLTGIFGGLAASLGAIKFADTIQEVAAFRNKLAELNESGLGTVEALSRIQQAARLAGTPFEDVTGALSKMVKGLAGSEKETSKAGEALRRLGIDARDSSGNLRDPAAIYEQLAGALDTYADGADKAAFAQAILGKGGERYLSMLKDMAEFGALQAKVTDEQARAAKAFERAQKELSVATDSVLKKIAGEFIPASTAFIGAMTDMLNANNGLKKGVGELAADGSLQDWARTAGGAVANLVDVGIGASRAFEIFGKAIGETGRNAADFGKIAAGALLTMGGNSVAGLALIKDGYNGLKTMGVGFKEDLEAIANRAWFSDAYAARYAANMKKLGEAADAAKPKLNSAGLGNADSNAKELVNPALQMMADAEKALSIARAEAQDPLTNLTKSEKALISVRESINWDLIKQDERESIERTLEQAAAFERQTTLQKKVLDYWYGIVDGINAAKKADDDHIASIQAKTKSLETEIENYGKLPSEVMAATIAFNEQALAQYKLNGASEETIKSTERLIEAQRGMLAALQKKEGIQAGEQMLKVWDDVATAGGRFFADLVMNGKSAFDRLKESLKSFAAEILAFFAKKFILQMIAGVSGSSVIGNAAAATGANSLAGMAGSAIWGSAAAGTGIAGAASNFAMGFSAPGVAAPGFFADAGAALAGMGPVGWAILAAAAVAAVVNLTRDKENPRVKLGFGSNAQGYVSQGVFGPEGFKYIETNDAGNQALRDFMKSLQPLDQRISKFLTSDQISNIGATLNAQGQREFSFAPGDNTASAQITLEYLKQKYSVVFKDLDATFAEFVKNFTGSAEDLSKAIIGEVNVLDMLDPSTMADFLKGIPDLTVEGLRKVQLAGETLSDTFTRVVNEFLTAQNNLNSAIAARNPQFARDLVLGQRNTLGAQFAASIGQQYDGNLAAQMALNPQSFTGLNTLQMGMLAQWLGLQTQLEQLDQQLAQNANAANNVTTSFNNAATAADDYAAKLHDSQSSLAGFLRGSIISSSPLSAREKYNEARKQLEAQFAIAEGNGPGALDARSGLGGFLQQFWDLSKNLVGSSGQGINDYWSYYNRAASLTGGQVQPYSQQDGANNTQAVVAALNTVAEKAAVNAQATVALANMLAEHGLEITSPTLLAALDAIRTGNTAAATGGVLA